MEVCENTKSEGRTATSALTEPPPIPPTPIAPLGGPPDDAKLLDEAAEAVTVPDVARDTFVEPVDDVPPDCPLEVADGLYPASSQESDFAL